jgi:3-phosphoshikimate 1-carboxyvinyltransferase
MMATQMQIEPALKGLRGEIRVPGDKSISHRAVILGAIARGTTWVRGFLPSDDCLRTVRAFRQMGVVIEEADQGLRIDGKGPAGLSEPGDILDMGNSGTSARLLTGLLSGQLFFSVLTGDASLRKRPMGRVVEPLRRMGARISGRGDGGYLPLAVSPGGLKGIAYSLPVASAQVKSGLMLAGLFAEGETILTEPVATRDHTERLLHFFGADVRQDGGRIRLIGGQALSARELAVPGDISSAAFFIVGASIIPRSDLRLQGVGVNPTRTGLLDVLTQMGASVELENPREQGGEPVADLRIRSARLRGVRISGEMVPRLIDEIPVLCIAAALAEGETVIQDAAELRVKESDRIETMAMNLRKMGVEVETAPDGIRIWGGKGLKGSEFQSFGDHRVAMSMAIAGLAAEGRTVIDDTECIQTSFPEFEPMLRSVV